MEVENDLWKRHIWRWYANELPVEKARRWWGSEETQVT